MNTPGYKILALIGICLTARPAMAKLEDVEANQEKSRNNFIQRFTEFTKDKNFVGKAFTPDGKIASGGKKTRFNADDGAPWQSDLTYHDLSYDVPDETFNKNIDKNDPNARTRDLYAAVSGHGAVSSGGGSSILERTVYGLHDRYAKAESAAEKAGKKEQEGIRFDGMFKVETKDAKQNTAAAGPGPNGAQPPSASPSASPEPVQRVTVRDEARPDIEKVGADSFQTLKEAAQTSPETMGTLAFYYTAANTALNSLWKSTVSNLTQRRGKENLKGSGVQLSESERDCDKWFQSAVGKIDPNASPARRDQEIQDLNKRKGECQQMVAKSYKSINPKFERDPNDPSADARLVDKGPQDEDARERDMRVQLEVLAKVGVRANSVPSNWQYEEKDEKAKVAVRYDESGQVAETSQMRMDEQVNAYNQQLQEAAKGVDEVRARFPDLKATSDQVLSYQIQPGTKSAMEITKFPEQAADENFEVPILGEPTNVQPPQNYNELVQAQTP